MTLSPKRLANQSRRWPANQSRYRRGFTLVELLISTGVIVVMLAVSLPAFLAFQRRQELLTAAQQVRDGLLEAQNYALAPRGSDVSGFDDKPAGADLYRVIFIKQMNATGSTGAVFSVEEQTNQDTAVPMWRQIKRAVLPTSILYCDFLPLAGNLMTTFDPPLDSDRIKGVFYSIKELGKITSPADSSSRIILRQKSGREQASIIVNKATGRLDIEFNPPPNFTCS